MASEVVSIFVSSHLWIWKDEDLARLAFRETLVAHKKSIVDLLIQETGKVRGNAEYDFTMLTDCLQFHIEQVRRSNSTVFPSPGSITQGGRKGGEGTPNLQNNCSITIVFVVLILSLVPIR